MDNRKHNSGTKGNKGGGGWTKENRELWTELKNEAIQQAMHALYGEDEQFRQKVVLKMLDKINIDAGDLAGKLELIIREVDDGNNTIQTKQMAEDSPEGQE